MILAIVSLKLFKNVHVLKIVESLLFLIQPIVYNNYFKKHYNFNKNAERDTELLKNRWSGFGVNLAAFIHGNTDVVVLTLITNLKVVSVYSIYYLVIAGIKKIILSTTEIINNILMKNLILMSFLFLIRFFSCFP